MFKKLHILETATTVIMFQTCGHYYFSKYASNPNFSAKQKLTSDVICSRIS